MTLVLKENISIHSPSTRENLRSMIAFLELCD